ncbi:unnamed protein product, partial [Rotaria sp. Silwood2]
TDVNLSSPIVIVDSSSHAQLNEQFTTTTIENLVIAVDVIVMKLDTEY